MEDLQNRLLILTETLQNDAGKDSLIDRFNVGYIAALKDMLNISVEELE